MQSELGKRLPRKFVAQFPGGVSIAYAIIPTIPSLEEPFRTEVRNAFAESLVVIWQVIIGVSGLGLAASALMKGLPLHTQVAEEWGILPDEKESKGGEHIELALRSS